MRTLAVILLLSGCDSECVCLESPVTLRLEPPLEAPGSYGIRLVHDGVADECTLLMPLPGPPDCGLNFSASDAGGIAEIGLPEPWRRIELTIDRGGSRVASLEATIRYRTYDADCEPACLEADPIEVATAQ